ncbi:MAG TPA: hypothetical protein VHJ82_09085, partial [Actinomycetota bacterium]|nr:hypothetical protein [Actinomycetota bacterium]
AGEFRRERWARGVADYAMWLRLADLGARFAVLGEPLIEYATAGAERMSSRRATQELAVARMSWSRWRRDPADLALIRTAIGKTLAAARIAIDR